VDPEAGSSWPSWPQAIPEEDPEEVLEETARRGTSHMRNPPYLLSLEARPRCCRGSRLGYRGTSLIRNRLPLGPYSRTMPRALGGGAVSYE